jgi:peptidoglycan/LPS O-acetylase OafA/YrhL
MFLQLESLRGLAACAVVLYHSPFNFLDTPIGLMHNAYLFVDLFFILSGFVMTHAYAQRINQGLPFIDFMVQRLGRIYPLHLLMLLVWVPYILIKVHLFRSGFGGSDPSVQSNATTFVTNLLLIHAWNLHDDLSWNFPSWSISVEFAAYLVFYAWIRWLDKGRTWWVPALVSAACYGALATIDIHTLDFTAQFGVLRCLAAFYLGVAVYRLHAMHGRRLSSIACLEAVTLAASVVSVSLADRSLWSLHLVPLAFAALVFVAACDRPGPVGQALLWTPIRRLGLWSYSIYMVNGIVMGGSINVVQHLLHVDTSHGLGWLGLALNTGVLAVVVALARPCYTWVECRGRDASRRWVSNWRSDRQVSSGKA